MNELKMLRARVEILENALRKTNRDLRELEEAFMEFKRLMGSDDDGMEAPRRDS